MKLKHKHHPLTNEEQVEEMKKEGAGRPGVDADLLKKLGDVEKERLRKRNQSNPPASK